MTIRERAGKLCVFSRAGTVLGFFLPPESDTITVNDENFSRVSKKAVSPVEFKETWKSPSGYELNLEYRVTGDPARVNVSVAASKYRPNTLIPYVYIPFELSSVDDEPKMYCESQEMGIDLPIVSKMPGEGITAWWGDRKYNMARTEIQLKLPLIAFECDSRLVIVGCPANSPCALLVHRDGKIESARRYFVDSNRLDKHEFFIGWSQVMSWPGLCLVWLTNSASGSPVAPSAP